MIIFCTGLRRRRATDLMIHCDTLFLIGEDRIFLLVGCDTRLNRLFQISLRCKASAIAGSPQRRCQRTIFRAATMPSQPRNQNTCAPNLWIPPLEEVLGLQAGDIDTERMEIHIRRAVTHPPVTSRRSRTQKRVAVNAALSCPPLRCHISVWIAHAFCSAVVNRFPTHRRRGCVTALKRIWNLKKT